MPRYLATMSALALLCTLLVIGATGGIEPAPVRETKEDTDAQAYFRKKDWDCSLYTRHTDEKKIAYLRIGNNMSPESGVEVTAEDLKMIAQFNLPLSLNMEHALVTPKLLARVAELPRLEEIRFVGPAVTDAGLEALAQSRTLQNVILFNTDKVTSAGVVKLATLPNLRALTLYFFELDDTALEALGKSKTLEVLDMETSIGGVTDRGLQHLARLPNLKALKLNVITSEENHVTARGIQSFAAARLPKWFEFNVELMDDELFEALLDKGWFPPVHGTSPYAKAPATPAEVVEINLRNSKVTDKGMRRVLNWVNVTSVHIDGTKITDETFKKMKGFHNLDFVNVDGTPVTGAGLAALDGSRLWFVTAKRCEMTEDGFKAFGKMPLLDTLDLSETKMKPEWVHHLAPLKKLKFLILDKTPCGDDVVKTLITLRSLERLYIEQTQLTDTGFAQLVALPKLGSLAITGTKVTEAAYRKAKKEHPDLDIISGFRN